MELQLVELHFKQRPEIRISAVKERIEEILGYEVDVPEVRETDTSVLIFHTSRMVEYSDGSSVPAQTAIFFANEPIDLRKYVDELQQSWSTPNPESLLEDSNHTLIITEMMARNLEPSARLEIFHGVLCALVEETGPSAIVFRHSQQVIAPSSYLEGSDGPPLFRPGSLNVRFFRIENSAGDMLMDTRGLNEIGLHDLQCHFRDLNPREVSQVLYDTSAYIVENGEVIESGNTIVGIADSSKWVCQFEDALVPPSREVIDINPGVPYAAGNRQN